MGMEITNLSEVIMAFKLTDKLVTAEARAVLVNGAKAIKQTARSYAPVDQHRIEKAIKLLPSQGNQYSLRVTIAVTGVVDGRLVDHYASIVHEYPWHKRGPLTRLKGPKAGPRYLTRAVTAHKKEIIEELKAAMNQGVRTAIQRSGVNTKKRRRK